MKKVIILFAVAMTLYACGDSYSVQERTEAQFSNMLNGDIGNMQWWRTSVDIEVEVPEASPAKVWLKSEEKGGTLYDYAETENEGILTLTAPQGKGNKLYLVSVYNGKQNIQTITLSGKTVETVTLADNSTQSTRSVWANASTRDIDRSSLYGNSILGNCSYYEFDNVQLSEYFDMMDKMSQEGKNAKTEMMLNCDYELKSNGPFNITWVAGNCESTTPHVLGYYYHSPGTYKDITYVDISETEIYDYIDGLAKVQYQVNDYAASAYGVKSNYWYDANFDITDLWGGNAKVETRRGDDSYNSMEVFSRYGRNMMALRGISFSIDVPVGMHLGFYDRWEVKSCPEQYDDLVKVGIKPYTTRENFKGTNYSAEGMNTMTANGFYFRSFIDEKDHVTWMGMENNSTGGDLDCNDVIFGVTVDMEIYKPEIIIPDITNMVNYEDVMPWTIAFEDVSRDADFDFNDAVILLTPDYENEKCCINVMAVGSTSRMYLHYDGPDGDQNLGELHELFGIDSNKYVNTTSTTASTPFASVDCVTWPSSYSMSNDARRFYIEIQRGTCHDCTDVITLADTPGRMPEALLVAGQWQWPKENTHIFNAYNVFPSWAKDNTKRTYWSWYDSPKSGTCVSY